MDVAETCEIALDRIKWLQNPENKNLTQNPYNSVDPAPSTETKSVEELKKILLNDSLPLFQRYRAMFSLRNMRNKESVLALGEALQYGSALFRHEVAFVLGQLQDENAVPYLTKSLENVEESAMVRHECAEALGAIATDECNRVLNKYLEDSARVVKESCEIALDMCEYENSEEFQYANSLNISGEK